MTFCIFRQLSQLSGHVSSFRHPPLLKSKVLGIFLRNKCNLYNLRKAMSAHFFVPPNANKVLILKICDLYLKL